MDLQVNTHDIMIVKMINDVDVIAEVKTNEESPSLVQLAFPCKFIMDYDEDLHPISYTLMPYLKGSDKLMCQINRDAIITMVQPNDSVLGDYVELFLGIVQKKFIENELDKECYHNRLSKYIDEDNGLQ